MYIYCISKCLEHDGQVYDRVQGMKFREAYSEVSQALLEIATGSLRHLKEINMVRQSHKRLNKGNPEDTRSN